jgi:hypothetical protein
MRAERPGRNGSSSPVNTATASTSGPFSVLRAEGGFSTIGRRSRRPARCDHWSVPRAGNGFSTIGRLPRPGRLDEPVPLRDDGEQRLARGSEIETVERGIDQAWCGRHDVPQRPGTGLRRHRRQPAHALHEVADAVGEIALGGRGETVDRHVGVDAEWHLAQQPPAQRVGSVRGDELDRVERVAERRADLAPVDRQVVVHEQRRRPRLARAAQDRRPRDRVEADDALADDVHAGAVTEPPVVVVRASRRAQRADVVRERVEPHVHDL